MGFATAGTITEAVNPLNLVVEGSAMAIGSALTAVVSLSAANIFLELRRSWTDHKDQSSRLG